MANATAHPATKAAATLLVVARLLMGADVDSGRPNTNTRPAAVRTMTAKGN
jgi:hypothetical protein